MARGYSRIVIMGNLTRAPELKYTPSGMAVGEFAVAVNRRYRHGEEMKEEVSYFDVQVWGKQAENVARYLAKGSAALIEGRLHQERWETSDGSKRSRVRIVADTVMFLDKKGEGASSGNPDDQGDEYQGDA